MAAWNQDGQSVVPAPGNGNTQQLQQITFNLGDVLSFFCKIIFREGNAGNISCSGYDFNTLLFRPYTKAAHFTHSQHKEMTP